MNRWSKTPYARHYNPWFVLYTFYPLFEVHLCTVTFGLMYGYYSRAVSNQERVIVARVRYLKNGHKSYTFSSHSHRVKVNNFTTTTMVDMPPKHPNTLHPSKCQATPLDDRSTYSLAFFS